VIRLADDRVDGTDGLIAGLRERPADDGVHRPRNGESIGQYDRRLDFPEFRDLGKPDGLAVRIGDIEPGRDLVLVQVPSVWKDRRRAGPDASTLDRRNLADKDALDIRDGVERAGIEDARRDPEIACPCPSAALTCRRPV